MHVSTTFARERDAKARRRDQPREIGVPSPPATASCREDLLVPLVPYDEVGVATVLP